MRTCTPRSLAFLLAQAAFLILFSSCVYWTPISRRAGATAHVIPDVPLQKWDIKSCGPGSLSSVLQHYGDDVTMEEWQKTLQETRGGVLSIDMILAARQRGFDARLVTGDRATIERELIDGRPVILMLQVIQAPGREYDFFHYVVLDGIDRDRKLMRTQFGDGKARWVKYERIDLAWKRGGYAALLIRPNDAATDVLRAAVELEEQGKLPEAAAQYRRLLAEDPGSTVAWTNLGNTESRAGNRAAAEEAFRKAIAVDPAAADALNNLAWLLFEEKRFPEAEELARRAVEAPAPDVWARLDTLARIQAALGLCQDAAQSWKRAIDELPAGRNALRADMASQLKLTREGCPAVAAVK